MLSKKLIADILIKLAYKIYHPKDIPDIRFTPIKYPFKRRNKKGDE